MRAFAQQSSPETVGRRTEILLVQNDLQDAGLAIQALQRGETPCRVTLIREGEEALDFLYRRGRFGRAPKPDVILLDMHLPNKDGLELLAEIKVIDRLCRIPVIVLTACPAEQEAVKQEGWAIQGFLAKPVDPTRLLALIRSLRKDLLAGVLVPQRA